MNALMARRAAEVQARRLAPRGLAPDFLAEAIWHRTLAVGTPPTDAEVAAYLARCHSERRPVSGRQEHLPAVHPTERYRTDSVVVAVERTGRRRYVARIVIGPRIRSDGYAFNGRTRASIHRRAEETWPGGTWTATLAQRDAAEVLRRWDLHDDDPLDANEAARWCAADFVNRLQLDRVIAQDEIDMLGRAALDWLDDELERRGLDLKQGDDCRRDEHRVVERVP